MDIYYCLLLAVVVGSFNLPLAKCSQQRLRLRKCSLCQVRKSKPLIHSFPALCRPLSAVVHLRQAPAQVLQVEGQST